MVGRITTSWKISSLVGGRAFLTIAGHLGGCEHVLEVGEVEVPPTTANYVVLIPPLSHDRVSPKLRLSCPPVGAGVNAGGHGRRRLHMKLARRIAIALSSVIALALAGGAHWKVS